MGKMLESSDRTFGKRIASWPWLPFVLLGCIYFIIHLFISPNMGDDVYYLKVFSAAGFDPVAFSVTRYLTWSSRTLIEGVMMAAVLMPPILWKLLDTLLIVVAAVFLSKLLLRSEYRRQGNVVIAALMLMLPFYIMNSAGWIATTVNYLWPLALGLIALYPLRKIADGEKLRGYEYAVYSICLLFAANAEQMCAILLAIYAVFAVMMLVKKKISVYVLIQLALCILSLVYILACPGNEGREAAEAAKWYPGYPALSLPEKAGLGVLATLKDLFLMQYIPMFAFALVLCILVWQKQKSAGPRVVSLIPLACIPPMAAIRLLGSHGCPELHALFSNDNWFSASSAVTLPLLLVMLVTIAAIVASLCLLFGKSKKALIAIGILALGFASKAAVGLSPTVWASGERTALFLIVSFIACTAWLLNEWDFSSRKSTRILFALSLAGGIAGTLIDAYYVILH